MFPCGPGSSVGIATDYGLDDPGIESRWGARFSAPVQTGPGAHSASCIMGTGSIRTVKRGRGVTLTPHSLLVPWSRKGRAIPLLPLQTGQSGDRIPMGARFSARPDLPWGPPSLLYNGYRVFSGGKVRPGPAADRSPPSSAVDVEE